MKYIVVYIIMILGLTSLKSEAQKPSIDLLPTSSESAHPEAIIDTSINHNSLVLFDSIAPLSDTVQGVVSELKYTGDASPAFRKRTTKLGAKIRPGLYPLIFKKINPISFIIFFTALKF